MTGDCGEFCGAGMRWATLAMCLVLAGCATKYQEMGFTGGVAAERITADTYRIVARGNGYTGNTTIQDYALLKAAELHRIYPPLVSESERAKKMHPQLNQSPLLTPV